MLQRLSCETREEWLILRQRQGIGGSEAAAAIGMSPWETPISLWRKKLGIEPPKDLSGNPAVERGNRMEPILRNLYGELHPEYAIEYYPYDLFFMDNRPWLFATLDGVLVDENGERGILEIKTASPTGQKWNDWKDGNLPNNYYIQTLHQLLATGFSYVRLFACLYSQNGDMTLKQPYEIERADVQEDLDWLLREETTFWGYVQRGEMPPQKLIL